MKWSYPPSRKILSATAPSAEITVWTRGAFVARGGVVGTIRSAYNKRQFVTNPLLCYKMSESESFIHYV